MRGFAQNLALFASLSSAVAMPALCGEMEDPGLERLAVESYLSEHPVGVEEATRRLRLQDRAAGIEDRVEAVLGEHFAGVWFDNEDRGRLKVGITRAGVSRSGDVQRIVGEFGLGDDAQLVSVRYSIVELESIKAGVRDKLVDLMRIQHANAGYDTRLNKVVVTALARLPSYEEALVRDVGRIDGVDVQRVDVPTLAEEPLSCTISNCDPPLRGGRGLNGCTGGFIAQHRVNTSHLLMLTAGHCVKGGFYDWPWRARSAAGFLEYIGTSYGYVFGGNAGGDAGAILIDLNWFWGSAMPVASVVVESSLLTAYNPNYKIKYDSTSTIGKVVCYSGLITKTKCGVISALGVDKYVEGVLLLNLGEISMPSCASWGDSGAPIYKINRAYGMVVTALIGGNKCKISYQGIRGAENLLNVDILTSS